jgi:hypothetical protein
MDDIHEFIFEGYYYADVDAEINYWQDAVDDPVEYGVDSDTAEQELASWHHFKIRFVEAFDKQKPSKVDYEDGTWV